METIEDVERLGAVLLDEAQIGLPHIRADEFDFGSQFFAEESKELLEGFSRALLANPEEASKAGIDLVDQGEVFMSFGILDFIDADGSDGGQGAMLQPPVDDALDGVADLIPSGMERLRSFLPGQLACPASQHQAICLGELMLAIAPGHMLDHHTALAAADAAHLVEEEDKESPER